MADDVQVTVQELSAALTDQIDDADLTRARGLADLLDIRLARLDGLRRELDLRRGVDDADPRLVILQQQLLVDEATVRSLDLEALRAATPPAAPVADAAMVQGRLVAAEGELPAGARVRLRDASGKLVSNVEGTLDASGAFSLKLPLEAGPAIDLSKVTVVVSDAGGHELARDERVILPAVGTVDYREINLPIKRRGGSAATTDAAGSAATGAAAPGSVIAGPVVAGPVAPGSVVPGSVVPGLVLTGPLAGTLPGRVVRATSTRTKASSAKAVTSKGKASAKTTKAKAKASSAEAAKPADAGATPKPSTSTRGSRTTKPESTGGDATGTRRTTTRRSSRTPRRPT